MIIQTALIRVQANRFVRHYVDLGYRAVSPRTILCVPWEHLPLQSNKGIVCRCDECGAQFTRKRQEIDLSVTRQRCLECGQIFRARTIGHRNRRDNNSRRAFDTYAKRVRELTRRVYVMFSPIINPQGFKRTRCGVAGGYQLDHKISVKEGFDKKLPIEQIAHIDNLQMLPWQENRQKGV